MSDPVSGTVAAGAALTGASIYGLLTGTDYGVIFGAFAGAVFYVATAADLTLDPARSLFRCFVHRWRIRCRAGGLQTCQLDGIQRQAA